MLFENPPIALEALPQVEAVEFRPLEQKHLQQSLLSSLVFWLLLGAGIAFFLSFDQRWQSLPWVLATLVPWGLLTLTSLIVSYLGFSKKAYAIRERDLLYRSGLIWHSVVVVPFHRIQHCSVRQGPIERLYGLAHVSVYTAGGDSSDLSIPGLKHADAHQLKDFILQQSGGHASD